MLGTVAAYTKLVANEPSVGLYFVQEHVRKSVPFVMATKVHSEALACTTLVSLHSSTLRPQARVLDTGKQAQLCRCAPLCCSS